MKFCYIEDPMVFENACGVWNCYYFYFSAACLFIWISYVLVAPSFSLVYSWWNFDSCFTIVYFSRKLYSPCWYCLQLKDQIGFRNPLGKKILVHEGLKWHKVNILGIIDIIYPKHWHFKSKRTNISNSNLLFSLKSLTTWSNNDFVVIKCNDFGFV